MGENVPHRPPKSAPVGDGWSQSGGKDKGKGKNRAWFPSGGGKGKDKGKGKGKKGDKKGKGKDKRKGAANTYDGWWGEDDWSNYQLDSDGTWTACDWENGWLGEDGHAWINPKTQCLCRCRPRCSVGTAAASRVCTRSSPGAGTTLVRSSRQSTATKLAKDTAPTANSFLDNNGQLTQLRAGADEFQWGVGGGG